MTLRPEPFANPLFGTDHGSWGKRLPVLVTLALLAVVVIGSGRRVQVGDPVRRGDGPACDDPATWTCPQRETDAPVKPG